MSPKTVIKHKNPTHLSWIFSMLYLQLIFNPMHDIIEYRIKSAKREGVLI